MPIIYYWERELNNHRMHFIKYYIIKYQKQREPKIQKRK